MSLIEMEHHTPPGGLYKPLFSGRKSHNRKAVNHNRDDSGFPKIELGNRRDIESQPIKASFKLLAKTFHSPPSAPAAA